MKINYIFYILFLFTNLIFSQEWEYRFNAKSKYPFEYTLKPNFNEPNKLLVQNQIKNDSLSVVKGVITDYSNSFVWGVTVDLIDENGKYISGAITDENGFFEIETSSKRFIIKFSLMDHLKSEIFNVDFDYFSSTTLNVKLGREQVLDFYVIFSKSKLSDIKIKKILECVKPLIYYESSKIYDCDNNSDVFYISVRL